MYASICEYLNLKFEDMYIAQDYCQKVRCFKSNNFSFVRLKDMKTEAVHCSALCIQKRIDI